MFGGFWVLFKVAGLAPWTTNKRGAFQYSWWSILTGYGFLMGAVAHFSYWNARDMAVAQVRDTWKNSATARVVGIIDYGTICVASIFCLLSSTVQAKNVFLVVKTFEDFESSNQLSSKLFRFRYGIMLGLLMTSLVIYDVSIGGLVLSEPLLGAWYLRFFLYTSEFMFSSAVLTLYELFRNANNKLRTSVHPKYTEIQQALQVLPLVDFVKGYGGNDYPTKHKNQPLRGLRELSALHWQLCTIGAEINSAFNGQLLALFVTLVVRVVTTPYFVFLMLETPVNYYEAVVANVGWVVVHAFQLCLLVWPCSIATDEMELFLVQLTSHKMHFTVYNMFTIDLTVMTSVAGAVTTYLVILIQFQNSQTSV